MITLLNLKSLKLNYRLAIYLFFQTNVNKKMFASSTVDDPFAGNGPHLIFIILIADAASNFSYFCQFFIGIEYLISGLQHATSVHHRKYRYGNCHKFDVI